MFPFSCAYKWREGDKKPRRVSPPARMKAPFTWENIRRTNYHHNRRGNSQPWHALTSNTTTINIVISLPWNQEQDQQRAGCRYHFIWDKCRFKNRLNNTMAAVCLAVRRKLLDQSFVEFYSLTITFLFFIFFVYQMESARIIVLVSLKSE